MRRFDLLKVGDGLGVEDFPLRRDVRCHGSDGLGDFDMGRGSGGDR
jgi:hypothetical protein